MPNLTRPVFPVLFLLAILLAACQSIPAVASLGPVIGTGPLVSLTVRGGECPEGACGGTTVIERDGRVHQTVPAAAELGQVPPEVLSALDAAIKTADFKAIKSRPFTGECPVNFDGQEQIFEFGAPGGVARIATCETEIDPEHPVFLAVTQAMQSVLAEPT